MVLSVNTHTTLADTTPIKTETPNPSPPVKIIFDSDMDGDCDDVAALALLHVLADQGEAEILATVTSCRSPWTPQCMSAINTYYGRPNLPIGVPQKAISRPSKYTQAVAQAGTYSVKSVDEAQDAVELYRRILLNQPDNSVVIATVGFHTNLAALLQLPAKDNLPSGLDLVTQKVKLWACMGGNFIGKPAKDDLQLGNVNFQKDAPATFYTINHWPTRLVFVGREVASVPSNVKIGANFKNLPPDHPVRIAYEAYFDGTTKDRHIADPATVLFAVRGPRDYWDLESKGHMILHQDMKFEWSYDSDKNQAYLLKRIINGQPNDHAIEKIVEDLIMTPRKNTPK